MRGLGLKVRRTGCLIQGPEPEAQLADHRRALWRSIFQFLRIGVQLVQFRPWRLDVFELSHPQSAQIAPTKLPGIETLTVSFQRNLTLLAGYDLSQSGALHHFALGIAERFEN